MGGIFPISSSCGALSYCYNNPTGLYWPLLNLRYASKTAETRAIVWKVAQQKEVEKYLDNTNINNIII